MYIVCLTSNKYGSGRKYFHLKEERLIPHYITDDLENALDISKETDDLSYVIATQLDKKIDENDIIYRVENKTISKCVDKPNCFLINKKIQNKEMINIDSDSDYDSDDSRLSGFLFN